MSNRIKKMLSLAKQKITADVENNYTSTQTKFYDKDAEWDPISNWVIEVDPEVLKNQRINDKQDEINILSNVERAISEPDQVKISMGTKCFSSPTSFADVNNIGQEKKCMNVGDEQGEVSSFAASNISMEVENTSTGIRSPYLIPDINIANEKQACLNVTDKQDKINILSDMIVLPISEADQTEQNSESMLKIPIEVQTFSSGTKKGTISDISIVKEKEQSNLWLPQGTVDLNDHENIVELKENQSNISTPLIIIPPREAFQAFQPDVVHDIVVEDSFTISLGPFPEITENYDTASTEPNKYHESEEPKIDNLPEISAVDLEAMNLPNISNIHTHISEEEVEKTKAKHYKDKKTCCPYCDQNVTHFSRHLSTYHSAELRVQEIHSMKPNSKQRRDAIIALSKEGNFIFNKISTTLRPVRRVESFDESSNEEYLPCSYCLGSYKKTSLHRHTKRCSQNNSSGSARQFSRINGQSTLLRGSVIHDVLLKEKLFPRMRADEVVLVAKKDKLICSYGLSYLKGRRSKGNIDFVRQTMRRLARLLMFARSENNCIKELLDLLYPKHFELIIRGVKKIGRYDYDSENFQSPTLALNFGTLLKKCCALAYVHYLQIENSEDKRKEVKTLKKLIESQWADEISAQAGADLSSQKWNKKELLPLTSDLKKFNHYLNEKAQNVFNCLQEDNKNKTAYNTLKEVLYCQIILLNRRRPAEVAQIKTNSFQFLRTNEQSNEFESCLTQTERILLNSFSRLVIRGKRGRGVAILLSPTMKEHFDALLKVRHYYVSNNNEYIFHTSGFTSLDGTKLLRKYAIECKLQCPNNITATRLRKHLATVTQLLQFSEQDLEQLSTFMGHTIKTHCNFYRLTDNMYQTAKVSKLLLLSTNEGLGKYKGMSLDDIDIELDPIEEDLPTTDFEIEVKPVEEIVKMDGVECAKGAKKRIRHDRIPWSVEEKMQIKEHFSDHIQNKRPPKQSEVQNFVEQNPNLKNRKWTSIKVVVQNIYTSKLSV